MSNRHRSIIGETARAEVLQHKWPETVFLNKIEMSNYVIKLHKLERMLQIVISDNHATLTMVITNLSV